MKLVSVIHRQGSLRKISCLNTTQLYKNRSYHYPAKAGVILVERKTLIAVVTVVGEGEEQRCLLILGIITELLHRTHFKPSHLD